MKILSILKYFGVLILLLNFVMNLSAQTKSFDDEKPNVVQADGNSCELNSLYVDMISTMARGDNRRVFIIAQAGSNETELVNSKRLSFVKNFLQSRKGWNFDVVYARGERAKGLGRLNFYVNGNHWLVMLAGKNETPCLDCCDAMDVLPQKLVKTAKQKRERHNVKVMLNGT